jgi:hypothetical protein
VQDPQAIISQAKSGAVPSTWRVLRPVPGYPVRSAFAGGCLTLFAVFFLSICGAIVVSANVGVALINQTNISGGSLGFPANVSSPTFGSLPGIAAGGAGVALLLVLLVALLSARYAVSRIPYSYFVFTPEGAVQSTGPSTILAMDYATLDLINLRIAVRTTTSANLNGGMASTSVSKTAELHYRDGHTQRWKPAPRFGLTDSIVQRLINGLQAYQQQTGGER